MNGARALQILGLLLLALGAAGILFRLTGASSPVFLLGAIGPIVMGCALLLIARAIKREG
jgi:hypothetical protein